MEKNIENRIIETYMGTNLESDTFGLRLRQFSHINSIMEISNETESNPDRRFREYSGSDLLIYHINNEGNLIMEHRDMNDSFDIIPDKAKFIELLNDCRWYGLYPTIKADEVKDETKVYNLSDEKLSKYIKTKNGTSCISVKTKDLVKGKDKFTKKHGEVAARLYESMYGGSVFTEDGIKTKTEGKTLNISFPSKQYVEDAYAKINSDTYKQGKKLVYGAEIEGFNKGSNIDLMSMYSFFTHFRGKR